MRILRLVSALTNLLLRLAGARRRRLRIGEIDLAYTVLGPAEGEPWVLLHGLGSVGASWAPILGALRRDCRILIPELSALGGTRSPRSGLGVTDAAEAVARLIETELAGRPATVTGISLGGWMAVRLALRRPDLVDAGGYRHQDWERIESLVRVEDLAGIDRLYPVLFQRAPWLMRVSRDAFLQAYTSASVRNALDGLSEADTFDDADLARLRMPVALLWAEHDGLFNLETARAMAAALPQARLDVIPGGGHAVHIESPRALAAALLRFRRAITEPRPAPAPAVRSRIAS